MAWFTCREVETDFELRLQAYDAKMAAIEYIELADCNAGGEIGGDLMRSGGSVLVNVVSEDGTLSQFDITAEASVEWHAHDHDGSASATSDAGK